MSGAAHHRGSSRQNFATPPEFVHAVEARFGAITVDLAASADNAKAPAWIDEERNSLLVDWHKFDGLLWLNPPFAHIKPWARKCDVESALGARIALLVPASVGSEWFNDHVHGRALVLPLRPRLTFVGADDPYPKDLMLCVFGEPAGFEPWRWKP